MSAPHIEVEPQGNLPQRDGCVVAATMPLRNHRPRSITIISWLFIAVGSVGVLYHVSEFTTQRLFDYGLVGVCLVRLLAIASGAFMLRGFNWARWLLVVWMVYHVILSAFHSPLQVLVHAVIFGVVAYFLFRPEASAYFRRARASSTAFPTKDETPMA